MLTCWQNAGLVCNAPVEPIERVAAKAPPNHADSDGLDGILNDETEYRLYELQLLGRRHRLDADSRMALITSAIRKAGRLKLDLVLRRETRYSSAWVRLSRRVTNGSPSRFLKDLNHRTEPTPGRIGQLD